MASLPGKHKYLALEESSLLGWIAKVLHPYVTEVIVCDPLHNAWISRGGNKDGVTGVIELLCLLRLGELKSVYNADEDHRADFKIAVLQFLRVRNVYARCSMGRF